MLRFLLVPLLLAVAASAAPAAAQPVGRIEKIAVEPEVTVDSVSFAQGEVRRRVDRLGVRQDAGLEVRDIVRLFDDIFVQMQLEGGGTRSAVVLNRGGRSAEGNYEIQPGGFQSLSDFALVVKQGVMVVRHLAGTLVTSVGGTTATMDGTTVLFEATSDTTGFFFLREGDVRFWKEDSSRVVSGRNRAWDLRAGAWPEEIVMTGPQRRYWKDQVEYMTDTVWGGGARPFWRRPAFYVPAAAAVVIGAAILVAGGGGSDDDGLDGRIVVTLPR